MKKLVDELIKPLVEDIEVPVNIGDTIKMGKFKNKKVVVKSIDWNEKGDLLINGRPALKFRLTPNSNIFDENKELYKLYSKALKLMPNSPEQLKVRKKIASLRKKLKLDEIATRPKPKKFRDIYDALPIDLKKRVMNLKNYDQRRDAHPEGNVLKHTIAVTNRALKTGDIDFALSALFHDIGKDETAGIHPKKGHITHYGHEKVSAQLVKKHATWIKSMGGDVDAIYYIVKQHMRMKVFDKMRWAKQDKMRKDKHFGKLQKFTKFDKGGRGIREQKEIKKVIGVFGGRFQPFHPGHLATYNWLKKQVDEAYITTSNIKQPPRHPMNFKEKVRHMVKMGIPKNRIIEEKSPYVAKNLLKKFDPETTAVVYVFGAKDAGRLKGGNYFKEYTKDMVGFKEAGYILTAPHNSIKIAGKEASGTWMRQLLGDPKFDDNERQKLFKKAFGYFDKGVYNMITNKFKKLFESIVITDELIEEFLLESTNTSMGNIDDGPSTFYKNYSTYKGESKKWLDSLYGKAGWKVINYIISDKVKNAIDKEYHSVPLTYLDHGTGKGSMSAVGKYKKWMTKVVEPLGWEVINWMGSTAAINNIIGTVFAPGADGDSDFDINSLKEKLNLDKEVDLITEGGAYGHLSHPFDNNNLTFSDFKTLIINTLQGKLDKEGPVTEKTDGQNIMVSWKGGKLVAARNKGHIKNHGANALDLNGIKSMFAGRGEIEKAFVFAIRDLENAVSKLSDKQKEKIFGEGSKFMSLEVMFPATANVIPYDRTILQFHGTIEYNPDGSPIGEDRDSARVLAGMIKQINQNVQKTFKIEKPFVTKLPKVKNFAARQSYFLGKLKKLQKQFDLKDTSTLADYHQAYWVEYIYNGSKQFNYSLSNKVLMALTKRWAFLDKSYKISQIRKDITDEKFLKWILKTDKQDLQRLQKQNIRDWEVLFFELGAEILSNMNDFIAANPDKSVQTIRKDLEKAINKVKKSKDPKVLQTLKTQLDRLNAVGGLDAVVPTEGITFVYKGKLYKYTGFFAPSNQILGMLKYV